MSDLVPVTAGSRLFATNVTGTIACGYLLAKGTAPPASLSLTEAFDTYAGWFVMTGALARADVDRFIAAADVFFANAARSGAFAAWFTNAAAPQSGLSGTVVFATRGKTATLTRRAEISFANLTLSLPVGTTIVPGADETELLWTPLTGACLAVLPYSQRQPTRLPLAGAVRTPIGTPTAGTLVFGLALDTTAADALDIGLRSYTAPATGGYGLTARHAVFALTDIMAAVTMTIDPLAPLDHTRSFAAFAEETLPTYYRSATGHPLTLKPTATACLVFADRLIAVDTHGLPVATVGNRVLTMVPSGTFIVANPTAETSRAADSPPTLDATLMCGLSAVEYLALPAAGQLHFVPDQPAFAPTLKATAAQNGTDRIFGTLSSVATTAWATFIGDSAATYYAQPDSAVLHTHEPSSNDFLTYLPVPAGQLGRSVGTDGQEGDCVPLMPYAAATAGPGLKPDDLVAFETQVWSPRRRTQFQAAPANLRTTADNTASFGTTPQGMLLEFDGIGPSHWAHLTLAKSPSPPPPRRSAALRLGEVSGPLKIALQSNQLALFISDGSAFAACGTIPYALTQERYQALAAQITDADVVTALKPLVPKTWPDQATFDADLKSVLKNEYDTWAQTIRNACADFSVFASDWEFDLSPWRWANSNAVVIFKFCPKPLAQIVVDPDQWTQGMAFNTAPDEIRSRIVSIFSDARQRLADGDPDFAYFVNTVMSDANWNGILVLNAPVPLSGLPPQLQGLAAGIDATQFFAHHLGVSVTPMETSADGCTPMSSAVFALIHYSSPTPLLSTADYDFKVTALKVRIANSGIAAFSSAIALRLNSLFGEKVTANVENNTLQLFGTYQKSGSAGTYAFTTNTTSTFTQASFVLYQTHIDTASFVTASDETALDDTTVHSYFLLNGTLSFRPQSGFDLFSYGPEAETIAKGDSGGGLPFSTLRLEMTFDKATPLYRTFTFDTDNLVLDAVNAHLRTDSLAAHFPMKLTGFLQATDATTPDSLGYMPVTSPLEGTSLSAPWFGLVYELDLGSAGALAANVGFTARLLLGWSPSNTTADGATLAIGLGMPGSCGGERALSLEGVLKLAFGEVIFIVQPPTYILQLSDIALTLLSLRFPPNGQINLLMFGNPDTHTGGALGWYAAYLKNDASRKKEARTARTNIRLIAPHHARAERDER